MTSSNSYFLSSVNNMALFIIVKSAFEVSSREKGQLCRVACWHEILQLEADTCHHFAQNPLARSSCIVPLNVKGTETCMPRMCPQEKAEVLVTGSGSVDSG